MSDNSTIKTATLNGTVAQYRFVEGTMAAATATDAIADVALGISQMSGVSGDKIGICVDGKTYLQVDGSGTAIAAGDAIMAEASGAGQGVKAAGATAVKQATALEAATTDGAIIEVIFEGGPKEVVGS